jgi:Fungal protein kinase
LNARVKPDIGIYANEDLPKDGECVTQAKLMLGSGELKNDSIHEPFALNQPRYSIGAKHPFERDTVSARDSRGQITLYANAIQATQFRTHSFSFFINKTDCRLIHWSRSCAIVTDEFNYTKTDWLPKFFWRLSHAPKHLRGIDTTFTPVLDDTEAQKTHNALGLKPKDATPLYKVAVKDEISHRTTDYIVSQPFTNNHIFPVGRGTRCFRAFDCQTKEIVLLKDTWRVDKYEREGSIYRDLHLAKVRNIAKFITAGDVGHVCGQTEKFSTAVQDRRPRVHYHYRLVLGTVGTSLEDFSSTWQMVNASTDALIGNALHSFFSYS